MFEHSVMNGFDGDPEEDYQKQLRENQLPPKIVLFQFIELFEEFWHKYSVLDFTEGRYEVIVHQHISATVDAAEHCLKRYGAEYPRSLVENKVREVREERYG